MTYLELSAGASDAHCRLVANNLGSHHGQGLALCWVDLARHDRATGLVLRQGQLAQAATRAGTEVSNVVRDLHKRASNDVECTVCLDKRIVCGERFELVRCSLELNTSEVCDLGSDFDIEAPLSVQTLERGDKSVF